MNRGGRTIRGEVHDLLLLKVTSRDPHGRPRTCEVLYDEEATRVDGGEVFVTAYVPAKSVEKRS